ncbi:hypothetical protein DI396_07400 [Litorivita pollutaquae]|uniref:Uncharacterized protein n=1 Tax=Litorivita pollutaquae TaxID=2200892 RepID=A0A2V4NST9_9RHOB|nr:hypothetical protein [Litorivita pollutaquae]OUS22428.1 hypothetical protein A9Q95_05475 [Rhodobacterales bacterium 59_46_T64]PYC47906.1 hypothetical protein DI396_07400 [Litorivita pollutaquae]
MAIISILFGAVLSTVSVSIAGFGFGASWNSLALIWLCTAVLLPMLMITGYALRAPRNILDKDDLPLSQAATGH